MEFSPSHWLVRRVALNTALQIAARALAALLGIVQIIVLTHYLHSSGYGQYAFVLSVVGLGAVITDSGLGTITIRRFAEGGPETWSLTLGGLLYARTLLALLVLVATDIGALSIPLPDVERTGILMFSLTYLLTVPLGASSLFQHELELQFPLAIGLVQLALTLILTVGLVLVRAPILLLLAAQLIGGALASLSTLIFAVKRYQTRIRPHLRLALQMLKEAFPVGIAAVFVTLYFRIDTVLLGLLKGSVDVAHYVAAYKFVDLGAFVAAALMASVYPLMARKGGDGEQLALRYAYQASADVMIFIGLPLAVGALFLAPPVIQLIYPTDFAPAIGALQILGLVIPFLFFNTILGPLAVTLHREKQLSWIAAGATLLNVGLNVVFIPRFGILAASVVTVVSELFVTAVGAYVVGRALGYIPSVRPLLLCTAAVIVMAVPLYLLRNLWPLAAVCGALAYLATARLVGFTSPFDLALLALRPRRAT